MITPIIEEQIRRYGTTATLKTVEYVTTPNGSKIPKESTQSDVPCMMFPLSDYEREQWGRIYEDARFRATIISSTKPKVGDKLMVNSAEYIIREVLDYPSTNLIENIYVLILGGR